MTTAKNDVTGDLIKSKIGSDQKYLDNYDAIFRKPQQMNDGDIEPLEDLHPHCIRNK